jgi:hypothetical protein
MTLAEGLVRGRSHIVFILGLATAGGIILTIDKAPAPAGGGAGPGPPTAARTQAAAFAWAAAARSPNAADVARARRLALALGVRPDAPAPTALSPEAGLATLSGLAGDPAPAAPPH